MALVALETDVGNMVPFHVATEFVTKFVPVKVRLRLAAPAVTLVGEMVVSVGPAIMKVVPVVLLPPGFCTATKAVPTDARRLELILALN